MENKIFFPVILLIFHCSAFGQSIPPVNGSPRYQITLSTVSGQEMIGWLTQVEDTAVTVYSGNRKDWVGNSKRESIRVGYSEIQQIRLKKKNGVLKGALIGFGIGIAPILVASTVIKDGAQGGAFVSIITVPLGLVTGSIIGATSKKKFNVRGDRTQFDDFRKRTSKY